MERNVTAFLIFCKNFFGLPVLFCTGGCFYICVLHNCGTKRVRGGGDINFKNKHPHKLNFKNKYRVSNTVCIGSRDSFDDFVGGGVSASPRFLTIVRFSLVFICFIYGLQCVPQNV